MTSLERARDAFNEWIDGLPPATRSAKGTVAVGLVILHRLKSGYTLSLNDHLAHGGAQIAGLSLPALTQILAEFGETRPFLKEAGRTNRGGPMTAESLLDALGSTDLATLTPEERNEILVDLQRILVDRVRSFHNRARLRPTFDPSKSTRYFVSELLALADETGKLGPVAQYLVGAKLQLRFPGADVRNESSAAADDPTGQTGDFELGNTTFHVTVAPNRGHFDKCKQNIADGRRVYLLVPEYRLAFARGAAELEAEGQIAVESIESFVGQNIEELAEFDVSNLSRDIRRLLEMYNQRVDETETDKSMMVDIPPNLARHGGGA